MREKYKKLLSVAYDLSLFLDRSSFEVHMDDESAFIDLKASSEFNPVRLIDMAAGFRVSLYPAGDYILVRVYED